MPLVRVPELGMTVDSAMLVKMQSAETAATSGATANSKQAYAQPFAVKINVTEKFLKDLMAGKPTQPLMLNLGKSMTIGLAGPGLHQFELAGNREQITQQLFKLQPGQPLKSAGPLTHKLEVLEIEEKEKALNDELAAAVKGQYEALGQHKKDRRAVLVDDMRELPPALSGKRGLDARKRGFRNGTFLGDKSLTPSIPNSPANLLNSPALHPVKKQLNHQTVKKDPLYIPLIHLLAIKSDSDKNIAIKTRTTIKTCNDVLIYMANRTRAGTHWDLTQENYKDLDVWKFPYPSPKDRDAAIENTKKAFGLLRIAQDAPEWEMLRKPEDRGKPLPKAELKEPRPSQPSPPSIRLNDQELDKTGKSTPEVDTDPVKPKKDKESAAISRIFLNGKNKSKGKSSKPTPKSTLREPKNTPKLSASEAPKPKKTAAETKVPAGKSKGKSKFISAEFILDSDEDMDDVIDVSAAPNSESAKKTTTAKPVIPPPKPEAPRGYQAGKKKDVEKSLPAKPLPPKTVARKTLPKPMPQNEAPRPTVKKAPSAQSASPRSASYSPKKTSPLVSSPPLNASDLTRRNGNVSSTSSSPLSSVGDDVSTPTPVSAYTSAPVAKTSKPPASKEAARPRYVPSDSEDGQSPPLKRKAIEQDHSEAPLSKASKTLSSSSESSSGLARKKVMAGSENEGPRKTFSISETKKRKSQEDEVTVKKVTKTTYASSVSSSSSSSSNDSLTRRAADLKVADLDDKTFRLIKKFRDDYANYQKLYSEVSKTGRQSGEKYQIVLDMHKKLEKMKASISASIA